MNNLDNPPPPDKSWVFRALCESRALRWRLSEWEWIGEAVDPLQGWAEHYRLVEEIGQDAVQQIMAEAFDD